MLKITVKACINLKCNGERRLFNDIFADSNMDSKPNYSAEQLKEEMEFQRFRDVFEEKWIDEFEEGEKIKQAEIDDFVAELLEKEKLESDYIKYLEKLAEEMIEE